MGPVHRVEALDTYSTPYGTAFVVANPFSANETSELLGRGVMMDGKLRVISAVERHAIVSPLRQGETIALVFKPEEVM